MLFDPSSFEIGGVVLLGLVFGLVEFIKDAFDMSGKPVTFLAAGLGVLFFVAQQLMDLLPEPYSLIVTIVVGSISFGLAASGYYKYLNKRLPKPEPEIDDQLIG